jgi:N-methylhydantoinase B
MTNVSIGGPRAARTEPVEGPAAPPAAGSRRGEGSFAYYETVGGGAGASPDFDGLAAVHTHMTNTMNTPVEALEMAYPLRLVEYSVRRGSGGDGRHRGGDGIRRTWEFLAPATVSLLTDRRRRRPWGLAGGEPGQPGRNLLHPASVRPEPEPKASPPQANVEGPEAAARPEPVEGRAAPEPIDLPSKGQVKVHPGDRLTLETPGGGAWGAPH